MKVAYFSPMPPEQTGIADYSALLLPALRERMDVEVVRRGARKPPRGTDVALYHVGNNPDAHAWIVDALRREPGVVVLHDFSSFTTSSREWTLARGKRHAYLDLLERDHGLPGRLLGLRGDGEADPLPVGDALRGTSRSRELRPRPRDSARLSTHATSRIAPERRGSAARSR